jgi:hypothetical protein
LVNAGERTTMTMLTDDQLQLITAAIDGELTTAEGRRFRQLLETSPEAREMYARLGADRERLRNLPRVAPPADLTHRVMRKIAALAPAPVVAPKAEPAKQPAEPLPRARRLPVWVPAAVAASVLVGVAASSFWLFRNNANNTAKPNTPTNIVPSDAELARTLPSDTETPAAPLPRIQPDNGAFVHKDVPPAPAPHEPIRTPVAPEPRFVQPDLVAFPPITTPKFDQVEIRVPLLRFVADFDRPETRQELAEELTHDPAFRLDLFARDPARAVEVFQVAAKAAGVTVHADATTLDRLKKRQVTSVMIYTEALTAAQVAEVFGHLATADAKISPRVFDSLHAIPLSRNEPGLVETLGRDPGLFKRSDLERRLPKPDPSKPISEGTAQHIVDRVGSGGTGTTPLPSDRHAVLVTWSPTAARTMPSTSAELKQFFAKRGDRKPGVVPVVIVIRPGNG